MERLLRFGFWLCLALTVVGWWRGDRFVPFAEVPAGVLAEPEQRIVTEPPFDVTFNDVRYTIAPKYAYDLHGMVVSYRYHDGDRRLHRLWNDHLNVADLCLVWGQNVNGVDLNRFDFHNGQFTCNFSTRDARAWRAFAPDRLSNNHLITDQLDLRERITGVRVGDLVRVRGRLAHYGQAGAPAARMRQTSTTRTDTGNGACETIWVDDFQVLAAMPNGWRKVLGVAGLLTLLSGGLWLAGVASGRFAPPRAS